MPEGERLRLRARESFGASELEERVRALVERAVVAIALARRHEVALADGLAEELRSPDLALDASSRPVRGVRREFAPRA